MSKKPNMTLKQRLTIRSAVRRICKAEDICGKTLSELTGISQSAASKMLSKKPTRTHSINSNTAGVLELWMADRAGEGLNNNPKPQPIPSEGKPAKEEAPKPVDAPIPHAAKIEALEAEVRRKDRAIADLSRMNAVLSKRLREQPEQPGYIEGRREAIEILAKYEALVNYMNLVLECEGGSKA